MEQGYICFFRPDVIGKLFLRECYCLGDVGLGSDSDICEKLFCFSVNSSDSFVSYAEGQL